MRRKLMTMRNCSMVLMSTLIAVASFDGALAGFVQWRSHSDPTFSGALAHLYCVTRMVTHCDSAKCAPIKPMAVNTFRLDIARSTICFNDCTIELRISYDYIGTDERGDSHRLDVKFSKRLLSVEMSILGQEPDFIDFAMRAEEGHQEYGRCSTKSAKEAERLSSEFYR